MKKVKNQFENNKNFYLNINLLDLKYFEESEFLITDNGGVGLEYSLIYRKPTMYINYINKIHNQFYKEINIDPIENIFKKNFGYEINIDMIKNIPNNVSDMNENFSLKINDLDNFFANYISSAENPSSKAAKIISNILK